uniref:Laminin alpha domain-containing protein n=1 Tax=Hucho hucho TaxID=62062 RepID=A0A4W5RDF6_9TELE
MSSSGQVVATADKASTLEDSGTNTHQRAQDLLSHIKSILGEVEDLMLQANGTGLNETEVEQEEEDLSEKIQQVEAMLREMRFRSCVGKKKIADRELSEAEKLLDKVKDQLVSRVVENEGLEKDVRERLGKFHDQLMDLRDALNQAVNNTAVASDTNAVNEKRLEDCQQQVDELNVKNKEVEDLLQVAEDNVATVNDMLSMLHDSKEDYERLAAQLDGSRMPLTEKVQKFSLSVSKIPLVEAAEKHAELLNELAMNLSSVISNTNKDGFIQRAVNASRAYADIIDAVRAAEIAANQAAMDAMASVQNQDLGQTANALRKHSIELVNQAVKLQEDLSNDLKPRLQEAKTRLDEARDKQDTQLNDLEMVQSSLNFSRGKARDEREIYCEKQCIYTHMCCTQTNVNHT